MTPKQAVRRQLTESIRQKEEVFLPFAEDKDASRRGEKQQMCDMEISYPLKVKKTKTSNERWHFYFKKFQVSQKYMLEIYIRVRNFWKHFFLSSGKNYNKIKWEQWMLCTKFCVQKILLIKNDILGKRWFCSILLRQEAFSFCLGE